LLFSVTYKNICGEISSELGDFHLFAPCLKKDRQAKKFWIPFLEMPSTATSAVPPSPRAKIKPTFQTLIREHSFQYPSTSKSEYPALQEAVQPHIDSFNAITSQNLLEIAIRDIGKKTIFDHKGDENGGRGNKLTFWLEDVQLSRPALTSRERTSLNRRLYPAEATFSRRLG
jgi:hypothetical protein